MNVRIEIGMRIVHYNLLVGNLGRFGDRSGLLAGGRSRSSHD